MPPRRCWLALALGLLLLAGALPVQAAVPSAGWGSAALLEIYNFGNAGDPQVSFNAAGAGFAVWWEFDGTRNSIFSNQFLPSSGWGVATLVEADNAGNAAAPQVAIDAGGNGIAVWSQSDGLHDNIWSGRFVAGSGWENATLLETDNAGNASAPQVAAGPNGTAFAVWYQNDGSRDNIYANRYDSSAGWAGAGLLENDSAGDARDPQIAIGPSGTAFAIWYQNDGSRDNIYASRYDPGAGWGGPSLLENGNAGDARNPQIAVGPNGTAFTIWYQNDGSRDNIYWNRYDPAAGWGGAALLENASGNARNPQIALGPNGTAFAIWYQRSASRDNIYAEGYTPASGWGSADLLEADNAGNARDPQIAVDASGAAFAVWHQSDGRRDNIWAQRFAPGAGWGVPDLIETNNAGDANGPQVAVDGRGGALAVWSQTDGLRINIWTNHYTSPDVTPPDLSLTSPLEGASSASLSVWVSGTTEPGATLSVNGVMGSVSATGSFGLMIAMAPGAQRIAITATDAWGNTAIVSVNLTVADPLANLQRQVDDAQAALNASEANLSLATSDAQALERALAAARSDLVAAQANLSAALDSLSVAQASISLIQRDIDLARGDLNTSAAHLAALEADQNASQGEIDAARGQVESDQARVATLEGDLVLAQSRLAEQMTNVTELQAKADAQVERLAAIDASLADQQKQAQDSSARASQAGMLAIAGVLLALFAAALAAFALMAARRREPPAPPPAPSVPLRPAHLTSSGAQSDRRAGETESPDDVTRRRG
jgi:hypothetical protein